MYHIMHPPSAEAVQPVEHKSKWGYHVCSYETYLQLKYLNGVYWESRRLEKAARRFYRKCPHNRVHRTYKRDDQGRRCGVEATRPASAPRPPKIASSSLGWAVAKYRVARQPMAQGHPCLKLFEDWFDDQSLKQISTFYHSLS